MALDFRKVVDNFTDAILAANDKGIIVYANPAAEKLLGWAPGTLLDQPLTILMPPRMRPLHTAGFNRLLHTGQPQLIGRSVRVPAIRSDGSEIDIELTLNAFHTEDGGQLFFASLRDLGDRVEFERQLTVSRYLRAATTGAARLVSDLHIESVLKTIVDVLVEDFDAALARVWLYDAATKMLHLRASAGLSTQISSSPRAHLDVVTHPSKVAEVARSGQPFIRNGLLGDPKFDQEWVAREGIESVAAFPLNIAGELRGVMVYFGRQPVPGEVLEVVETFVTLATAAINDVLLFAREQEARAEAERANGVKANFLRLVSHEFRTPLTTLRLQMELLRRDRAETLSPAQLERVGKMFSASTRLMDLVDSLLEYARIESGQLNVQVAPVDVAATINELIEDLRVQADQRKLYLRSACPDGLPPIQTDQRLLRLIVSNLMGNAIKYTRTGGVEISASLQDDQWRIGVKDTGPGIPEELHHRVFEAFEQFQPLPEKQSSGVGLGLALVKEMVQALGGRIELESRVGVGSAFTVVLPADGNDG